MTSFPNPQQDYVEVADNLGIKRGTAWSIIRRFQSNGVVCKRGGGKKPVKWDINLIAKAIEIIGLHPKFTINRR